MDLKRLSIPEQPTAARGSGLRTLLFASVALGVGVALGWWLRPGTSDTGMSVETIVARPGSAGALSRFTAGGWIEVATPEYPVTVCARVPETVEVIQVKEGDTVTPGMLLAQLYDVDVSNRLNAARAEEAVATAELDRLVAGYRKEDIAAGEARLAESRAAESLAESIVARNLELSRGAISAEQLTRDEAGHRSAVAVRSRMDAELARLRAGFRSEEIAAARARLAAARVAREQAELDLSYCRVTSPEVARPLRVLKVHRHIGERLHHERGMDILSLYDPEAVQVRVDVTQSKVAGVGKGSPVLIVTEADRDRQYRGTVLRIEPQAELSKNTITVKVRVDDPDDLLFPEMVAQITFLREEEESADPAIRLPESSLFAEGDRLFVFVVQGGVVSREEVEVGEVKGGWAEILDGIQTGQRVVTSQVSELTDGQAVSLEK